MDIRSISALLLVGLAPLCVGAQRLDRGAIAEVVMGMVGPQNEREILSSTNLLAAYNNIALEQDLAKEAARRGLTEDLQFRRAMELSRRNLLIAALRNDITADLAPPTEKEIQAAFASTPARWNLPEAYRLDIYPISNTNASALNAARQLATGKPIADNNPALANFPVPPASTQTAGPWFSETQVTSNIWSQLKQMAKDEARLFPDGEHFVMVRLGERREKSTLTVDQVRETLAAELADQKAQSAWRAYVEARRAALNVAPLPAANQKAEFP